MIACPKSDPGFAINPIHGELAQHRFLRAVLQHVPRRGLALDVGAHIGLWTRALAMQFKYVVAFEPVIENYVCLTLNSDYVNVRRENVALGASTRTCSMVIPARGNSGCWYAQPVEGPTAMRTLDSYTFHDVDLIKLDVEGLEGAVLAGGKETIFQGLPTIVFEENGLGKKHYGESWIDPQQLLAGWRYKFAGSYHKNQIWVPA